MATQHWFRSLLILFFLGGSILLGSFFFVVQNHVIDFSVLENYNPGQPSILYDDEGNEWGRFQLDRREPIAFDKMPKQLINAFIAAEDRNFFSHHGISW